MSKVFIVGWDGATFDLIKPWVREGKLPNIARLMKSGVHGPLRSTLPPMTFTAWSSFMTGRNPGQHGVYDFTRFRPGTYQLEFVNGGKRKSASFWRMLSQARKKVVSISVPCTFPPEKVNGVMLSGFDAPGLGGTGVDLDSAGIYPPEVHQEIQEHVGGHPLDSFPYNELSQGKLKKALDLIVDSVAQKAATAKYLMENKDWDCFMILFGESDGVGHYFWHHGDVDSPLHTNSHPELRDSMFQVYEALDKALGELIERLPAGTQFMMMSDHGFGGISNTALFPNCWLRTLDCLQFRGSVSQTWSRMTDWTKTKAVAYLPVWVKRAIYKLMGARLANIEGNVRFAAINWNQTRAFFDENPYYPTLWINLKGRQPKGTVEPGDEYEKLRTELIDQLKSWRHPETNEPIVKDAYRREEVYHGVCIESAPDIIIHWNTHRSNTFAFRVSSKAKNLAWTQSFDPTNAKDWATFGGKSGHHRDEGIFVAQGPAFRQGVEIKDANIMDVCPTILHLLGVPAPNDLDGKLLKTALCKGQEEVQVAQEVAVTAGDEHDYSAEEEELIAARLRALGYLN